MPAACASEVPALIQVRVMACGSRAAPGLSCGCGPRSGAGDLPSRPRTEPRPRALRLSHVKASATGLPPGRVRRARSPGSLRDGSSRARLLAPARAAVAGTAAVLATAALAACGGTQGPPAPCGPASPQPPGWTAQPRAAASYVSSGLVPPYYVAVSDDGDAFVQASATGRTLAVIRPPAAGETIATVTAAPGDRTFIAGETQGPGSVADAFYLFQLSSSGRPGALSRLPVPVPSGESVTGFALSPDARKLAVAVASGPADQESGIEVDTLATGAVRTWTANGPAVNAEGTNSLAWTQDERTLSFAWGTTQARLLSLGAPGGNLLTASRAALTGASRGWACTGTPVITPDGKTLACPAQASPASSVPDEQVAGVAEYAAASGTLERVLGQHHSGPAGPVLWWENTSGSVLIGAIQGPYGTCPTATPLTVGVITGNRLVALPGLPELPDPPIQSLAW